MKSTPATVKRRRHFGTIAVLLLALCLTGGLRLFVFEGVRVTSASMVPALRRGDLLLVARYAWATELLASVLPADWAAPLRPRTLRRYDLVVVERTSYRLRYVKRVVGLPGDRLAIRHGRLYINGKRAADDPRAGIRIEGPPLRVTLGERELFFLGDNRNASLDSRFWRRQEDGGALTWDAVRGTVLLRYWPLNRIAFLWRRRFSP